MCTSVHYLIIQVHNIVIFVRTSGKLSYVGHMTPELLGDTSLWIVPENPQVFRNCSWFFHGSTCQKRHNICSQGLSSISTPGGRNRGETGSLNLQQTSSLPLGRKTPLCSTIYISLDQQHDCPVPSRCPANSRRSKKV